MSSLAVTSLCEFAARRGDLDHRYTPTPSAEEGIAGHARVRRRRGGDYQAEYALQGECEGLQLGGRADGYDAKAGLLEEIKTHRGDLRRLPAAQQALHRAQLRAYGALLCASEGLDEVTLRLCYYDIGRDRETHIEEQASADDLWQDLQALCQAYREWHNREQLHRAQRDAALAGLKFPFGEFRRGQRELAESVFKTVSLGRPLLLQAPTGIGKTVGTLFPALMALARGQRDRVFYLTARNSVRGLAFEGLQKIFSAQPQRVPLRVLELSARTQSCEHPEAACHGESCPLAAGFFDRLPGARLQAVEEGGMLDQARLARIAEAHEICPYYLAQEMARWCDLVVADVNRFFDQSAILHALTRQNNWRSVLLIDEAHNLINRARGMYSADLAQQRLLVLKRTAPGELKKPLQRLAREWTELIAEHGLNSAEPENATTRCELDSVPRGLCATAQGVVAALIDYLGEHRADAQLQELLFELLGFLNLAEVFDSHSLCTLSRPRRGRGVLSIQNLIPADFLAPRFAAAHASVLFSATLAPAHYYQDLLGLGREVHWQDIPSPFAVQQLTLHLVTHISTRLSDREASLTPIVALIIERYRQHAANYLAYFSSFAYLDAVYARLEAEAPDIPCWRQHAGMSAAERNEFIERFSATGQGVGFAVLGGMFAEGIDLPGKRLSGVFIATLGLPPFDAWHETLRQRLQESYGRGYDYAYLFPGLQKVVQAAGRVIRTPEDEGVVVLIDDRFVRPEVRRLLPGWWGVDQVTSPTGS